MKTKQLQLVPGELIGAWRRTGLIIDDKRCVDYCDVLWLQSESWFADIRLRLSEKGPDSSKFIEVDFAEPASFAGIANWDDPMMTWKHILDKREQAPSDVSPIVWRNGGILEGDTMRHDGRDVPWAEEWVRLTDNATKPNVSVGEKYVRIEIGNYAIEVNDERPTGRFTSKRFDLVDGQWVKAGSVQS